MSKNSNAKIMLWIALIIGLVGLGSTAKYMDYQGQYSVSEVDGSYDVIWLRNGDVHKSQRRNTDEVQIFCHCGGVRVLISIWRSVYVEVKNCLEYTLFEGENATEVVKQYRAHMSSWLPILPWRQSVISLPAFSNYCIGMSSVEPFELHLVVRRINYWKVLQLIVGVLLFFVAPSLSRNILFYYASGISVGVLASLLIIVFIVSRFVPKKAGAYSIMLLGWSLVLYFFQLIWSNLRDIAEKYQSLVMGYMAVAAIISFAVCYRYGPLTDNRTKNLIQWGLQLIALALVFYSSEIHEISMALIILIVTMHNIPAKWIAKARHWWHLRFPPKIKLLSEADFIEQAAVETRKSLEELRKFCRSPECNAWRTVCRLKDPIRFAKFMEGESHLKDEEILDYESEPVTPEANLDFTDDETDEEMEILNAQIRNWTRPI